MRGTIAKLLAAAGVSAALLLGGTGLAHAQDPVTGLLDKVAVNGPLGSVIKALNGR